MGNNIDYSNYIIAHHLDDKVYRIPMYPTEVSDTLNSIYQETQIIARSAPLQSWISSGPRTLSFSIEVHRDLDYDGLTQEQINNGITLGDINKLIDEYQALTLPNYSSPMLVIPPKITIRIGTKLRITGIPDISYVNKLPVDKEGVYQAGVFTFSVKEIEPYEAKSVESSLHNARGRQAKITNYLSTRSNYKGR